MFKAPAAADMTQTQAEMCLNFSGEWGDLLTLHPAIQNIKNLCILSYLQQYNKILEMPVCGFPQMKFDILFSQTLLSKNRKMYKDKHMKSQILF